MTPAELIQQVNTQQPELVGRFKQAVSSQQLAHAFLFTGPKGHGQALLADWLAMRLMCETPTADGEPDGTCSQCLRIAAHEHPDVIEIEPDGNSIKIEQIRYLRDEFTKTAVEGTQKIFIIEAADTMTDSAANGLLKFIEEPVGQQTAILMAENRQQILPTIISRTQVVDFHEIAPEDYLKSLAVLGYDASMTDLVAQLTDSVTTAAEWLEDDWFVNARNVAAELVDKMVKLDPQAFNLVQTAVMPLATNRNQSQVWLRLIAEGWRDILLLAHHDIQAPRFPEAQQWVKLVEKVDLERLLKVQEILLRAPQMLGLNISLQTTLETTILQSQFELAGN